jgi:hypothetical protein
MTFIRYPSFASPLPQCGVCARPEKQSIVKKEDRGIWRWPAVVPGYPDEEVSEERLHGRGLTCPEIAAEVGVDQRTVHRYLLREAIPLRATRRNGCVRPADRLTKRYLTGAISSRQLSVAQVAEKTRFAWVTVRHNMRIHRVACRSSSRELRSR